jgi:predicted dehydrogenase
MGAAGATDVDALLADPSIDVVHICTPNSTHADLAVRALEAGKHVVCEKPIATTVADAERMADAARASGLIAAVPFVYRFHPMVREARERIAASGGGRILTVQGAYLQDWLLSPDDSNWRVSSKQGGPSRAFADIGSHLVDLVEFITGARITRLRASTRKVFDERQGVPVDTEDIAAAIIELEGGGVGTMLVSQAAPGRKNALSIEVATPAESFRFEGLPNFTDGLRAVRVTDAVLTSAESGADVEL